MKLRRKPGTLDDRPVLAVLSRALGEGQTPSSLSCLGHLAKFKESLDPAAKTDTKLHPETLKIRGNGP